MSMKTEYGVYNEDDFVERGGTLEELTVTITLREYRVLIRENAFYEIDINNLNDEITELKKRNEALSAALLAANGGKALRSIGEAIGSIFSPPDEEDEPAEQEEPKPLTNGDKLRRMRDEELEKFLDCCRFPDVSECPPEYKGEGSDGCTACRIAWLKREADDEN